MLKELKVGKYYKANGIYNWWTSCGDTDSFRFIRTTHTPFRIEKVTDEGDYFSIKYTFLYGKRIEVTHHYNFGKNVLKDFVLVNTNKRKKMELN